ncbi:TPA: hypothetical protein DIV55_03905 [Patescibacteria group bacterium]|uniref:Sortase family protein n=1 Tax=Candidatus Gottesmanbacteria bacterium GW2011_GWA1_43_11 TaxID=1618436 RepID=A0A0G1CEI7_9BACT|nr:MAG: hypothetical protein UV59_C0027G0018 [Candidatus Gottesmanbacteria bacterium GW2011_GWA1_43_11]HCS78864.1 hypothetical protein [Patescibacteria group bacterium]
MIRQSGILFDQSRSLAPQISGSIRIRTRKRTRPEGQTSEGGSRTVHLKQSRGVNGLDGNSGVGQASEFPFKSWLTRAQIALLPGLRFFLQILLLIGILLLRTLLRSGRNILHAIGDATLRTAFSTGKQLKNLLQQVTTQHRKLLLVPAKRSSIIRLQPIRLFPRLGTLLMCLGTLGFLLTYGPLIQVELGYRLSRAVEPAPVVDSTREVTSEVSKGGFATLVDEKLIGEIPGVPDPQFSLIIPKIHAKSKIIANVNPADETSYLESLKTGVAHAAGTGLPGTDQTIYLFAHSTESPLNVVRFNAVFYLLRELEKEDEVQIYYQGVKHRYFVTRKVIVDPTDTSYLAPVNSEQKERLILQTCWPPGTRLQRLLVFAEKKPVNS